MTSSFVPARGGAGREVGRARRSRCADRRVPSQHGARYHRQDTTRADCPSPTATRAPLAWGVCDRRGNLLGAGPRGRARIGILRALGRDGAGAARSSRNRSRRSSWCRGQHHGRPGAAAVMADAQLIEQLGWNRRGRGATLPRPASVCDVVRAVDHD
jgi:hypothetical protein